MRQALEGGVARSVRRTSRSCERCCRRSVVMISDFALVAGSAWGAGRLSEHVFREIDESMAPRAYGL